MKQNVFFDYVYINDFIKIIDYFINHKTNFKFYNIGSGRRIDLLTITEIINNILERKSRVEVKKKGLNNEYSCNNNRLMSELSASFKFTPLRDSVKDLLNYYMDIKKIIKKNSI